jgi:hypothetical protein
LNDELEQLRAENRRLNDTLGVGFTHAAFLEVLDGE